MDFLEISKVVEPEDIESYHQISAVEAQSPVFPVRIRLLDLINYIVSISGSSEVAADLATHIADASKHEYAKYLINYDESSSISVDYLFELLTGYNSHVGSASLHLPQSSPTYNALSLNSPWVSYGSSTGTPSYSKDSMNVVRIIGCVKSGGNNTVITTIPTGYRTPVLIPVLGMQNSTQYQLNYAADGTITYFGTSSPASIPLTISYTI